MDLNTARPVERDESAADAAKQGCRWRLGFLAHDPLSSIEVTVPDKDKDMIKGERRGTLGSHR
jgi:hypothetical protein